jgi:alkaline phosphatase
MVRNRTVLLLVSLLALSLALEASTPFAQAISHQDQVARAPLETTRIASTVYLPSVRKTAAPVKHVIIMISDGWGYNHIEAASYYAGGQATEQIYHDFPVHYAMSTYMDGGAYDHAQAWREFDYVKTDTTDSAAAATALSTAVKTCSGAVGVDPTGQSVRHVLEAAEALGKATGVVTTVQLSHATPAGFAAHNVHRENYAEIANEMIYTSTLDLILGAGHPCYDVDGAYNDCGNTHIYVGGEETWADLSDGDGALGADADGDGLRDAWTLVQTRQAFQALATGPTPKRVIGVAQVYQTLQQERTSPEDGYEDPFVVPFVSSVPTLSEMTGAALNVLDDDPDGLFLMIEAGAVDWAGHLNQSGRVIEEQAAFDQAVQVVIDWVRDSGSWSDTLLIVTGDHETGYLTGPGSDPGWEPIAKKGAGNLPGMEWHSLSHTNSLIPLFAEGDAASLLDQRADRVDPVHGPYVDNVEVAEVVFAAMGSPLR